MNRQDLFVGAVSGLLGIAAILGATVGWSWCVRLKKAHWLQDRFGAFGARLAFVFAGLLLLALGVGIALGYRWPLLRITQNRQDAASPLRASSLTSLRVPHQFPATTSLTATAPLTKDRPVLPPLAQTHQPSLELASR